MVETPRAKRRRVERPSSAAVLDSPAQASKTRSASRRNEAVHAEGLKVSDDTALNANAGSSKKRNNGGFVPADVVVDETGSPRKSSKRRKSQKLSSAGDEHEQEGMMEEEYVPILFSSLTGEPVPSSQLVSRRKPSIPAIAGYDTERDELNGPNDSEDILSAAAPATTPGLSRRKKDKRRQVSKSAAKNDEDVEMPDMVEELPAFRSKTSRRTRPSVGTMQEERVNGLELRPLPAPRRGRPPKKKSNSIANNVTDRMETDILTNGPSSPDIATSTINRACKTEPSEALDPEFALLHSIVLSKLANRRPIPLTNLANEYSKVHALLSATVQSGESNSMLLIGARGSGKTALVNSALLDLSRSSKEQFHVVRLNGFIQTDDKIALRQIWRQLGVEMNLTKEEESGPGKSYADTLTMLLGLLSHPDELTDGPVGQVAKSVIFVMDEFDLFTLHPRQTLLYNLLDIAQSKKAPIAVLGLTTRVDVTDRLEKRVKSRFSHRYVHLALPNGVSQFVEIGKAAMQVTAEELRTEEKAILSVDQGGKRSHKIDVWTEWNRAVDLLFMEASFLRKYIHPVYNTTKSIPILLSSLLIPISNLTTYPSSSHFVRQANTLSPPTSNLTLLPHLSELALSLLIAAARLTIIHDTETLNFALTYAEYVDLVSKVRINNAAAGQLASGSSVRLFGRDVARKEWEGLVELGLLVSTLGGAFGLGGARRGGKDGEMFRLDVALEEVPGAVGVGLSRVMERWCKQI